MTGRRLGIAIASLAAVAGATAPAWAAAGSSVSAAPAYICTITPTNPTGCPPPIPPQLCIHQNCTF